MMTFAQWEKVIRLVNENAIIHTICDNYGQVVKAWTGVDSWSMSDQTHSKTLENGK